MFMATSLPTQLSAKRVVDALPRPIITPVSKVGVDTLPRWVLPRQHPPLTPTHDDVHDRIDDPSHLQAAWSASWLGRGNEFFDTIPLTVGQIGWIQVGVFHPPSVPPRSPGCHPFSNSLLGMHVYDELP